MPPPTVCLLDGEAPHMRAALHLLEHRDVQVIVGHAETADAERVKHLGPCGDTHAYPDPLDPTSNFEESLVEWLSDERPDVVVPLGIWTTLALSRHLEALSEWGVEAPVPMLSAVETAIDRAAVWSLARRIGMALPQIVMPHAGDDVGDLIQQYARIPATVPRSLLRPEGAACHADSSALLAAHTALERRTGEVPALMERIPARGGWLAVTLECDTPGGVMARLCESWTGWDAAANQPRWRKVIDHPRAVMLATELMTTLAWTGAATVQFAMDERTGALSLLQVWPSLHGNLTLGAAAGLDLLWPLVEWALGHAPTAPEPYRTDLFARWQLDGVPWLFAPREMSDFDGDAPEGERVDLSTGRA